MSSHWNESNFLECLCHPDQKRGTYKNKNWTIYQWLHLVESGLWWLLLWAVPNGYPNPTRYPVFFSIPDPTRLSFENHRVAGNPKYRVLPDISGKPEVLGITRYFGYSQTWLGITGITPQQSCVVVGGSFKKYHFLWSCPLLSTKIETAFPTMCALRSQFHVFLFQDSCTVHTYAQNFAPNMFAHLPFRTLSFSFALKTAPLSLLMQNKCIF